MGEGSNSYNRMEPTVFVWRYKTRRLPKHMSARGVKLTTLADCIVDFNVHKGLTGHDDQSMTQAFSSAFASFLEASSKSPTRSGTSSSAGAGLNWLVTLLANFLRCVSDSGPS